MSKTYSMAGIRLGWACGPKVFVKAVSRQRDYHVISCGMIDDKLATIALENKDKIIERNLDIVRTNIHILDEWINQEPLISYVKPEGGTTAFLKYDIPIGSEELCFRLLQEKSVMLLPGKAMDMDEFDTDSKNAYKQLIVWDPKDQEILGGYRYIQCSGLAPHHMATSELFNFSEEFIKDYLPFTIELGRSFIQPNYQSTNIRRKGLYALDNLWDGLGALMLRYPHIKYFFGKVTMYSSYNERARNTLLYFLNQYFRDEQNLVVPVSPLEYDNQNPYFEELFCHTDYKEAYKALSKEVRGLGENIPPLINSYMNLSPTMKVFGTAINESFGGVEETGIMINISEIYPEKIERYLTPLRKLALKFHPKW